MALDAAEDNTIQGDVNLEGLSKEAVTEAFDEPLTKGTVLAIAIPFLA